MNMFRSLALAAALAGTSLTALADKVVTYTIDPGHTQVRFTWNHLGFSMPGAVFTDVNGSIEGNHDAPEKSVINVSIPVKSLDSHVPLLNEHLLQSGDYFKAKEFPTVTFRSKEIRDLDRSKQSFKLVGELTVNGISREVVLDGLLNKAGAHPFYENAEAAGFNATTTIRRSDFGMGKHVPMVSDELDVRITVEAVEANAYKAAVEKQKREAGKAKAKQAKTPKK
jgi:polyisoprenoid-binding protein YceI